MIISNEMWQELKRMKQEILDLKQVKKASSVSKYYIHTESAGQYYNSWKITYKDGIQPIIAEVLSYSDTALSSPSGNEQYLFSYSQAINDITVLSTREIIKIEGIS